MSLRYVVYGAGAIGGVLGGRLREAGREVVFIARGENREAIERHGLVLQSPEGRRVLEVPVVGHPREIRFTDADIVILATKSHQAQEALTELAAAAPSRIPVVCAQNGVENERLALRQFERVIGMYVFIFAAHLTPGAVRYYTHPLSGVADVGSCGRGQDDLAETVAADLRAAGFDSLARTAILPWKYGKLLDNLVNAIQALCGPDVQAEPDFLPLARGVVQEGITCLQAAGIDFVPRETAQERLASIFPLGEVDGEPFPGGSSWQSLARGAGRIETDYLNGEIVLQGRLHGVPTPINEVLQTLARQAAGRHSAPGSVAIAEITAEVARRGVALIP
jgi:2-dehydropantoate 2-reductase